MGGNQTSKLVKEVIGLTRSTTTTLGEMDCQGLTLLKDLVLERETIKDGLTDEFRKKLGYAIGKMWICVNSHGIMRFRDQKGHIFYWEEFRIGLK